KELTIRGLVLGALITTVFTAANVYLGLKVGLTFASSIPAAVMSMAILSAVKDSSILENNIVQTVASAAGTLSAIISVLPGRVRASGLTGIFRLGAAASTGCEVAWSRALLGAGHLVGLSVGMAMLVGQIISWVVAVPILTSTQPAAAGVTLAAHTMTIWRTQV